MWPRWHRGTDKRQIIFSKIKSHNYYLHSNYKHIIFINLLLIYFNHFILLSTNHIWDCCWWWWFKIRQIDTLNKDHRKQIHQQFSAIYQAARGPRRVIYHLQDSGHIPRSNVRSWLHKYQRIMYWEPTQLGWMHCQDQSERKVVG